MKENYLEEENMYDEFEEDFEEENIIKEQDEIVKNETEKLKEEIMKEEELKDYKIEKLNECITSEEITYISKDLLEFVKDKTRLPNYLELDNQMITIPEYTYLATRFLEDYIVKDDRKFKIMYGIKDPKKPYGAKDFEMNISINEFQKYNKNLNYSITKTGQIPDNINIDGNVVAYQDIVFILAYLIVYGHETKQSPLNTKNTPYYNIKIKEKVPYFNGYKSNTIPANMYNLIFLRQ